MFKYTRQQFWQLYKKLPEDLKETLFSEQTANDIEDICKRNEVPPEDLPKIVDLVREVLMGTLPLEEFQRNLEKELRLGSTVAKKISQEINRFIFLPVRKSLFSLYQVEIAPGGRLVKPTPKKETAPEEEREIKKEKKPSKEDVYREPVE